MNKKPDSFRTRMADMTGLTVLEKNYISSDTSFSYWNRCGKYVVKSYDLIFENIKQAILGRNYFGGWWYSFPSLPSTVKRFSGWARQTVSEYPRLADRQFQIFGTNIHPCLMWNGSNVINMDMHINLKIGQTERKLQIDEDTSQCCLGTRCESL